MLKSSMNGWTLDHTENAFQFDCYSGLNEFQFSRDLPYIELPKADYHIVVTNGWQSFGFDEQCMM